MRSMWKALMVMSALQITARLRLLRKPGGGGLIPSGVVLIVALYSSLLKETFRLPPPH